MYTYIYIYRAPLDIVEGMSPKMQPTPKEKKHMATCYRCPTPTPGTASGNQPWTLSKRQ